MKKKNTVSNNNYWLKRRVYDVHIDNLSYVSMDKKDSVVMIPVAMRPVNQYKITVSARKVNGNGKLLVSFFGGDNYQSKPAPLTIDSKDVKDYNQNILRTIG